MYSSLHLKGWLRRTELLRTTEKVFERPLKERERGDVTRQRKSTGRIWVSFFGMACEFLHKPWQYFWTFWGEGGDRLRTAPKCT